MKTTRIAAGVLAALAVAGCGGPGKPPTVPATGTATYKGQPAAEALVVFHPAEIDLEKRIGGKPFATVKEDGTFVLTTYGEGDGAPEGEYRVTVEWKPKGKGAKFSISSEGGGDVPDKLGGRYGDQRSPKFTFTVKAGQANNFELKLE